ncbi:MAG: oligosaccharide flippase family protein [Theionarchaea archaeon]|nr:oligosaccharide flippase family protein [Theionarchaea archaeon]
MTVISIPIFTHLLTQEDYGIVAVFQAYIGIFIVILSLNAHAAVARYYFENKDDFEGFVGTTLSFIGLMFGVSAPLFIIFYRQIGEIIQLTGILPIYLMIGCLFSILSEIYVHILIPQKRSKEVALINIAKGYTYVLVSIVFVYFLEENKYLGRIWASLLVGVIFSIYFLWKMRSSLKPHLTRSHLTYIAQYSFPLIPYTLSSLILAQFDRIMINSTLDAASAGLYSLGYNIGMLLLMVISATRTALVADFYTFLDNKEYDRLNILVKRVFSIVVLAALGLLLFAREVGTILADEKFHPGLQVVPIVVIGYVFFGMFTVYNKYILYEKKTMYVSLVVLTAGVLNIVLNAIFIPQYGYIAAAYTTLISYFVMFLLTWVTVKRISEVVITPLWMIWKPTLIMFVFIFFVSYLSMSIGGIAFFMIKLVVLALAALIIFLKEVTVVFAERH